MISYTNEEKERMNYLSCAIASLQATRKLLALARADEEYDLTLDLVERIQARISKLVGEP